MDFITAPWPWYVAGPMIALVLFLMLYAGKSFGVSSNLRTLCSIGGAGHVSEFFRFDWKSQIWNLVFIAGAVGGGFIASHFLSDGQPMQISEATVKAMAEMGLQTAGPAQVPAELFGAEALSSWQGILFLIVGGLLIGFGTRYAGGCTSGHAISGLSNLQWPSLVAVIGFFIGGLIMTFLILPQILS